MNCRAARESGFSYIGLLALIIVIGLMLSMASQVWSTSAQRERETQLLFVGHAYRNAIAAYFANGHRYPAALQDLLQDERFPIAKRYLRRLYADPVTGQPDWTLILTPDGQGVMGVVSSSQAKPMKMDGFDPLDDSFKNGDCYCAWRFVYYANRFNRWIPPSTGTASDGGNGPDPGSSGSLPTFKPGTISSLPSSSGSLLPPSGFNGSSRGTAPLNGPSSSESSSPPN